jgi:VWFA-related protein
MSWGFPSMRIRLVPGVLPWIVAAGLVLGSTRPAGQTQSPPGQATFRSTTSLVEVDVMVRDDHNQFVLGLTADDLNVLEDDKPQVVEQCYLVSTDVGTGVTSIDGSLGGEDDMQSHRLFVLVFDEADLETSALLRIKQGALDFLNKQFKPGDFGGVVVGGQLFQGKLTRDRSTLLAAVRAVKPAFDSRYTRLLPFRQFPRIPGEAEAERLASGDPFLTAQLGTEACQVDATSCSAAGGLLNVENKLQQKARLYIGQARDATRYTLESLQHVVGALATVPGRKTVVFLSDGFFTSESTTELQRLAGMAARAGLAIYAIDGRGLGGGPPESADVLTPEGPISAQLDRTDDGAGMLADGTGAFVVRHATDIAHSLSVIADDTSTYYVVGYRPTNATMDGKFRKISVKTKRPGLHIRARTGYVATPLPALVVK